MAPDPCNDEKAGSKNAWKEGRETGNLLHMVRIDAFEAVWTRAQRVLQKVDCTCVYRI